MGRRRHPRALALTVSSRWRTSVPPQAAGGGGEKLKKMQHAVVERTVSTALVLSLIPMLIIVPVILLADQDTINYIVPFLTFLTVLPLASVSSRSFDLNESSRRRPILTFFSFLIFGAVSTTILGGIWENSGFVLIIPTAFCFVVALNQEFLDGFWNRFFGSWSKRFSPDARPGPNDVSLALAGWIFLMALSAAVIYASRYLEYRNGVRGSGRHPSALGSAITLGAGGIMLFQIIVFDARLRNGFVPGAATQTQSLMNVIFTAVVLFVTNSFIQGVWPGDCDATIGGWCSTTAIVVDVFQIAFALLMVYFRKEIGGAIGSIGRGRAKRYAVELLHEAFAPSIPIDDYVQEGIDRFKCVALRGNAVSRSTESRPGRSNPTLDASSVDTDLWDIKPSTIGHVDYFVVCTGLRDPGVRNRLEELSWRYYEHHHHLPKLWIHDLCVQNPADNIYLPIFASGCRRAVILVSNLLLAQPNSVIQLFTAMAVHCEPDRVLLEVLSDVGSVFSDQLTARVDAFDVTVVGANVDEDSSEDDIAAADELMELVERYGGAPTFSSDVRGFQRVIDFHRDNLRNSLRLQPHNFADILKSVMHGPVAAMHPTSGENRDSRVAIVGLVFLDLAEMSFDERAVGVFEVDLAGLLVSLSQSGVISIPIMDVHAEAHPKDLQVLVSVAVKKASSSSWGEDLAFQLAALATEGQIKVGDFLASDAFVAVTRRIPREIPRQRVERLATIGSGISAEVFKARVHSEEDGMPYYLVAVKTTKGVNNDLQRDTLLKEAALMALLDHQNVINLVAVVTAPRDLPAFLLLEYCENGSLLEFVHRKAENVPVSTKLSLCMDVCRGMKYLSSRRVVHGDLAARNVLLDSALQCKIADFGQSHVVPLHDHLEQDDFSEYASNYIKSKTEALPVRWAAIEVLTDGRYSPASDIWSTAVVIYEVMSNGATPFAQFRHLDDVRSHVLSGKVLECPPKCHRQIYERLMLPCWVRNPADRIGFTELYYTALSLGGVGGGPDDIFSGRRGSNHTGSCHSPSIHQPEVEKSNDILLRGVSVGHLAGDFVASVRQAVLPPYVNRTGHKLESPDDAVITDAVAAFAKPKGLDVVCPRDGLVGAAYVDLLTIGEQAGPADALLSYTWQYKLSTVVDALSSWAKNFRKEDWERTFVWICALCLNQHRVQSTYVEPGDLALEFRTRVQGIGRILPLLAPWSSPLYTRRIWCLFELYTAIRNRQTVDIEIILAQDERQSLQEALSVHGFRVLDAALEVIKSKNAEASHQSDLRAISDLVMAMPGGFRSLDDTVRAHLRWWFEQCGVQATPLRLRNNIATVRRKKKRSALPRERSSAAYRGRTSTAPNTFPIRPSNVSNFSRGLPQQSSESEDSQSARRSVSDHSRKPMDSQGLSESQASLGVWDLAEPPRVSQGSPKNEARRTSAASAVSIPSVVIEDTHDTAPGRIHDGPATPPIASSSTASTPMSPISEVEAEDATASATMADTFITHPNTVPSDHEDLDHSFREEHPELNITEASWL